MAPKPGPKPVATIRLEKKGQNTRSVEAEKAKSLAKETAKIAEEEPAGPSDVNAESEDEGDSFEDLEQVSVGMVWCHVLFNRADADLKNKIIEKIGAIIRDNPGFSDDCVYVADFEQAPATDPELMKIYVSFEKEEDLHTFQGLKTVEIPSSTGKRILNITQPDVWYKAGSDGTVKAMIKNVPKGWSNERCLRLLDSFRLKGAQRSCVKEAKDAMRLKHKGGMVPRGMLVCTVVAHEDDPEFKELRSTCFVPFGRGKKGGFTLYVGCTIQKCDLCLEQGHMAQVHEKWANRTKGLKRKSAVGLIRQAKRRETGLPESVLLKPVLEDPDMEFVTDKGLGMEAWRCSLCKTDAGEAICGESFSHALKHVGSDQHKGIPQGELGAGAEAN